MVLFAAFAIGACGGDDSSGGGGGGPDTRACAQITTDPTLTNTKCNNVADRCFFETHNADIRKLGGTCATTSPCVNFVATPDTPEAQMCFTDCLDAALKKMFGSSLSKDCLICPQRTVVCSTSAENMATACVPQCINDPNAQMCTDCLCQSHPNGIAMGKPGNCLIDALADCAGFKPTAVQAGCASGDM